MKPSPKLEKLLADIDEQQKIISEIRPLSKTMTAKIQDFFKVGMVWSSNKLEGNTLTESETQIIILDGLTVTGKPVRDLVEAVGLSKAFDYLKTLTN